MKPYMTSASLGLVLSSFCAILFNMHARADASKAYSEEQFMSGLPIAECMKENDWLASASTDINQPGTVFIQDTKFDLIVNCIESAYANTSISAVSINFLNDKLNTYLNSPSGAMMDPKTRNTAVQYINNKLKTGTLIGHAFFYTGTTPKTPINKISVLGQIYRRVPDYPGMCDEVKDPTSKKWCTGELSYSAYENQYSCKNNHNNNCGTTIMDRFLDQNLN